MEPIRYEFNTLPQFVAIVQNYSPRVGWAFRGQTNSTWPLLPKAGRPEFYTKATSHWRNKGQTSGDLGRFKTWREQAVAVSRKLPKHDLECLAYAQHYGLATRLLDWSENSLVALYFATVGEPNSDGVVYCHFTWWLLTREAVFEQINPETTFRFKPLPFDRRIVAQSGVFTYHHHPELPLLASAVLPDQGGPAAPEGVSLVAIRVKKEYKSMYQRQLSDMGITSQSLFPDLEGVSAFVNWETRCMNERYLGDTEDDLEADE